MQLYYILCIRQVSIETPQHTLKNKVNNKGDLDLIDGQLTLHDKAEAHFESGITWYP